MNLRAVTIGISAAFLALACSSSDDKGTEETGGDDVGGTPAPAPSNTGTPGTGGTVDPPGTGGGAVTPVDNTPPDINDLYVESLLQTNCGKCHGEAAKEDGNCRAGMCYIEDVKELIAQGKIVPGKPGDSPLYSRITRTDGTVMPPPGETQRLTPAQIQNIEDFILRKEAPVAASCTNQFISWDDVYDSVERDLLQQEADDRVFTRYISLADRYNAGVCDQQLEQDRFAMNKFINSISQNPRVQEAEEVVGSQKTIYRIDLRDYDLDVANGPFVVNGTSFVDGWEAIIGNNQFAIEFEGDQADNVKLLADTTVPLMFSDAVIDEASFGNLYYGLLQLGDNRVDVQADLGLDLQADLDQKRTVRAGTTTSEISEQERLAQRNEQAVGGLYYYESFDLDPDVAGNSIFADPLGFDQQANGSEAVFSLPNGLQAYIIFDAAGLRLEESPILFDKLSQNDNVMRAGVSCMNCHKDGLVPFDDQVRAFVDDNPLDAAEAAALAGGDFEDITDLYPLNAELQDVFKDDSSIYLRALAAAGVPTAAPTEPIASTFIRFDRDADLSVVAGLTGFPVKNLAQEVNRLDPALSGLDNGFKVDIDDFKGLYANTLCVLTVAEENRPLAQVCIDAGAI